MCVSSSAPGGESQDQKAGASASRYDTPTPSSLLQSGGQSGGGPSQEQRVGHSVIGKAWAPRGDGASPCCLLTLLPYPAASPCCLTSLRCDAGWDTLRASSMSCPLTRKADRTCLPREWWTHCSRRKLPQAHSPLDSAGLRDTCG